MHDFLKKIEHRILFFVKYLTNGKNFSELNEKFTPWVVIRYLGSDESDFEPIAKIHY